MQHPWIELDLKIFRNNLRTGVKPPWMRDIKPFFSFKATISYFKALEAGEGISYGHSYTTKELTRIITVPVGYGDGFRRALSNKGHVLVRGVRHPIVGAICMDQFMVDIGKSEAFMEL